MKFWSASSSPASYCSRRVATLALVLALSCAEPVSDGQPLSQAAEAEAFSRRACKFRPLPKNLDEGYVSPAGLAHVAETFGIPFAALVSGGHNITARGGEGLLLGFSAQVPFAAGAQLLVTVIVGDRSLKCVHTWGAGGHMKSCGLSRIQLMPGTVMLNFRIQGLGGLSSPVEGSGGPAACLTLRLDLEISSREASQRAMQCLGTQVVPQAMNAELSGLPVVFPGLYSSEVRNGIVWRKQINVARESTFSKLFARLSFPSMVHPLRLLVEEVGPGAAFSEQPMCHQRCFTGSPVAFGQIVQRLLPPGVTFVVWILSDDSSSATGECATYDFELAMESVPAERMSEHFLGPPAWLCEGGAWPARLEQLPAGDDAVATDPGDGARAVLRARRFALRDIFDLTRPPSLNGGLHTLEIQVVSPSVLRLTTHFPAVAARPVLVPVRADMAWQYLSGGSGSSIETLRIPAAGREFRHSISTELQPGEYTLLFILEMPIGGLRPCASLLVNLLLEPSDSGTASASSQGSCTYDLPSGALDPQAQAEPVTLSTLTGRSTVFTMTLPRPLGSFEEGAGDVKDLQILARSAVNLGSASTDSRPVLLLGKVTSPFLEADVQITFYEGGSPVGEPRPLADGGGYSAMVGPVVKNNFYEVVLLHAPQKPSPSKPFCVTFSVEMSAVILDSPVLPVALWSSQTVAPLPGASTCSLTGQTLPTQVTVIENRPLVLEGEFLLPPPDSTHAIQISAPAAGTDLILKAVVSSQDAEVRIGKDLALNMAGHAEDFYFMRGGLVQSLNIRVARLLSAASCPLLKLHLVLMRESDAAKCPSGGILGLGASVSSLQDLSRKLATALSEQPGDAAKLNLISAVLPGKDGASFASERFVVLSAMTELRVELAIEQPWLPLELIILRDGQERPWARARATGQRIVLLLPSLPKGSYAVKLQTWVESSALPPGRCALVFGSAALLAAGGRDTSNYRQEMLDLPELLPVISPPGKLTPNWSGVRDNLVWSQIYAIPAASDVSTVVRVDQNSIVRLVAEPADILSPRLTVELRTQGQIVAGPVSLVGPGLVQSLAAGEYTVKFAATDPVCQGCVHDNIPFFMTIGVAKRSDSAAGGAPCESVAKVMDVGANSGESAWLWKRQMRLQSLPTSLKLPVKVLQPSVVMIAAWSPFAEHYVRVAFSTEEGLWVGEQRARLSSLEIELPPGTYQMNVEEPAPLSPQPPGCMDIGVAISMAPFTSVSASKEKMHATAATQPLAMGPGLGLGARCDGLGAMPLPLDMISASGGSSSLGGPIDIAGRVLIRERVLLTDIHDGRKKVFLRLPASCVLRIAVVSGDAETVEVVLEDASHHPMPATDIHVLGSRGGQAASYLLQAGGNMWLSFHREHREASGAGCAAFELLVQAAPFSDMINMRKCPENGGKVLQDLARSVESEAAEKSVASAEGIIVAGEDGSSASFQIHLQMASLVEVEVQFNLLLSNVHVWLEEGSHDAAGPTVGATGLTSAPLNTHAVLLLRLSAGSHTVHLHHDKAFLQASAGHAASALSGAYCAPLKLSVRHLAAQSRSSVVSPSLGAPISFAADVVMMSVTPLGEPSRTPLLGGLLPTASTSVGARGFSGGAAYAWSASALSQAITEKKGHEVVSAGSDRLWALPLTFEEGGESGEVWIALENDVHAKPWSGGLVPLSASPERAWPDSPTAGVSAASNIESWFHSQHTPEAGVSVVQGIASKEGGGGFFSYRLLCWLAILALLAYAYKTKPAWFVQAMSILERPLKLMASRADFSPTGELHSMVEITDVSWNWRARSGFRDETETAQRIGRMYGTIDA